jgi:hypothetical protein
MAEEPPDPRGPATGAPHHSVDRRLHSVRRRRSAAENRRRTALLRCRSMGRTDHGPTNLAALRTPGDQRPAPDRSHEHRRRPARTRPNATTAAGHPGALMTTLPRPCAVSGCKEEEQTKPTSVRGLPMACGRRLPGSSRACRPKSAEWVALMGSLGHVRCRDRSRYMRRRLNRPPGTGARWRLHQQFSHSVWTDGWAYLLSEEDYERYSRALVKLQSNDR